MHDQISNASGSNEEQHLHVDTIRAKKGDKLNERPARLYGQLFIKEDLSTAGENRNRLELTIRRAKRAGNKKLTEIGWASACRRQVSDPIRLCTSTIMILFLMLVSLLDDLDLSPNKLASYEQQQQQRRPFGRVAGALLSMSPAGQSQQQHLPTDLAKQQAAALNAKPITLQALPQATGGSKQADAPVASFPQASSREIEKQIVDKILGEGYDKRIRPAGSGPYNASRPGK